MTATALSQPTAVRARLSWLMAATIAAAAFLAGLGVANLAGSSSPAVEPATRSLPAFDVPRFRLDEHQSLGMTPALDAAQFRLGEHTGR